MFTFFSAHYQGGLFIPSSFSDFPFIFGFYFRNVWDSSDIFENTNNYVQQHTNVWPKQKTNFLPVDPNRPVIVLKLALTSQMERKEGWIESTKTEDICGPERRFTQSVHRLLLICQ